ncbi:MAG: D-alanyl-D-alanine carboxypeptidase [Cyanobacteria bacterium P01_F01_bin.150]
MGWAASTPSALAQVSPQSPPEREASPLTVQPAIANTSETCPALTTKIDPIINQPTFIDGDWGIIVSSLDSGKRLYSHHANHYFIPASNIKLLTTAAALRTLQFPTAELLTAFYDWIYVTNQESNNRYADALLRRLGGTESAATSLESLGINKDDFRQVDGSGLSRQNMAKPSVFIETLIAMTTVPERDIFYYSLPVAGHSGTLKNRFHDTSAQGIVRAKTGTLRGVRALSGYMDHPTQGTLVFSILVNQPGQSGWTMLNAIDQIVVAISEMQTCN